MVVCQAPLSMGFPRLNYWSGLPFSPPGDLPIPGIESASPALAGRFFTSEPPGKAKGTLCVCVCVCVSCSVVSDSCDPMDYSLPGSSVRGILQARILEWVAFPFSKGSSQPSDWTQVFHFAGRFFTIWATREARLASYSPLIVLIPIFMGAQRECQN